MTVPERVATPTYCDCEGMLAADVGAHARHDFLVVALDQVDSSRLLQSEQHRGHGGIDRPIQRFTQIVDVMGILIALDPDLGAWKQSRSRPHDPNGCAR